jgi:hypothetical protein
MKPELIFGLIIATVGFVCGTLLLLKMLQNKHDERIEEKRIEAAEKEERKRSRTARTETEWVKAYYELDDENELLKTRIGILEDQLRRAREQMATYKIASLGSVGGDKA